MNKNALIPFLAILAIVVIAPFSIGQAQQLSESRLAQLLKRFPEADTNGDGKLTAEEFQAARQQSQEAEQRNARQAAAARAIPKFDPGWEEDAFPPHAVSLKTPEEIMAIYKRGEPGRTYAESRDALSFPEPAEGILRIVGTGHSFTAPGYRTLPAITRALVSSSPFACITAAAPPAPRTTNGSRKTAFSDSTASLCPSSWPPFPTRSGRQ